MTSCRPPSLVSGSNGSKPTNPVCRISSAATSHSLTTRNAKVSTICPFGSFHSRGDSAIVCPLRKYSTQERTGRLYSLTANTLPLLFTCPPFPEDRPQDGDHRECRHGSNRPGQRLVIQTTNAPTMNRGATRASCAQAVCNECLASRMVSHDSL